MNPSILRWLLSSYMGATSGGVLTPESHPGLFKRIHEMQQQNQQPAPQPAAPKGDMQRQAPIDRISDAFQSLRDMHKGPDQEPEDFQAHFAPRPQPMQAQASMPALSVPMPQPRPAEAPHPEHALSGFMRSQMLAKDPMTGDYLDPQEAAKADPGIFKFLR